MKSQEAGQNLHLLREAKGVAPADFATLLGIRPAVLAEFEAGTLTMSERQAVAAAAALGVDPILLGVDPEVPHKTIPRHVWNLLIPRRTQPTAGAFRRWWSGFRAGFRRIEGGSVVEDQLFHPDRIPDGSPRIYLRIALGFLLLGLLAWFSGNTVLIDLSFSAAVPVTLLWYLYERHEPRTISGATLLLLFLLGGLFAIFLVFYERSFVGYWSIPLLGDLVTGLVEESAKILIVILVGIKVRMDRPITGILVGFAVGAGVSVIETMDYGIAFLMESGDIAVLARVVLERSFNALVGIGHHYWTGMVAGAVAAMSRTGRIRFDDFFRRVPLGFFALAVAIHAVWNYMASYEDDVVAGWRMGLRLLSLALFVLTWVAAVREARAATPPADAPAPDTAAVG